MEASILSLLLISWTCLTEGAQQLNHTISTRSVGNGMGFVISENSNCYRKVKGSCQPLQISMSTCFGVPLPYTMTSSELVNENFTQQQLHSEMMRWEGLRSSPRCWAVIQPLLCSYYFPKCQDEFIELPPLDRCRIARNPCRVIEDATKQWPEFLQCNITSLFPPRPPGSSCKYELRESLNKFNTSAKCMDPMTEVENTFNHYEGFDGCALKCEHDQDSYFSKEDHSVASTVIWYFGVVTLFCNGWVVLTYIIGGVTSSQYPKYPSAIILYANAWYFIATVGWLFQYLPLGKEDIVCRKDGTVRRNEITGTENIFCAMVSSWIYFSIMSVLAWLMVFAYVWYLACSAVGRMRNKVDKQRAYFIVWAIAFPTILTVICLSVGKIDGSSIYGICFVGFYDPTFRIFLVCVPVGLTCAVILFYTFRGAYRLLSVSLSSSDFISAEGSAEIKSNAFRAIIFSLLTVVILVAGLILQIDSIRSQPNFEKSLRESFLCKMNLTVVAECGIPERPNVSLVIGNVIVFFCGGLLVSSWAWTSSSISAWKRSIKMFCKSDDHDGHRSRMPKHQLISKAYAKRNELPTKGRLSLSLYSLHEDPIGLNRLLDPSHLCRNPDEEQSQQQFSQATGDGQEISSEWAAAIPQFVNRRGAIVLPPSSNSASYVSEDSRRPSCDSAMSEQIVAKYLQGSHSGRDRKGGKPERFRMDRYPRAGKFFNYWKRKGSNRGSSTSLESNPGSQILPAITKLIDKREQMDDNLFLPNNQTTRLNQSKIVRERAIQTSIEKLYSPSMKGTKQCNLSNNLCADKATQSSLVSLHEIGTQTKKSATKKRDKTKQKKDYVDGVNQEIFTQTGRDDPVLKLLSPK